MNSWNWPSCEYWEGTHAIDSLEQRDRRNIRLQLLYQLEKAEHETVR